MLSDLNEKKLTAAFAVVILAIIAMGATVFLQVNAMERARMDRARASAVQREAGPAQFYWRVREAAIAASLSNDVYYLERLAAPPGEFQQEPGPDEPAGPGQREQGAHRARRRRRLGSRTSSTSAAPSPSKPAGRAQAVAMIGREASPTSTSAPPTTA